MYLDVVDLRDFYASPVGQMVARHLAPVIEPLVRSTPATRVLGFGFATPYLGAIGGGGARARLHAGRAGGDRLAAVGGAAGSATALVEEDSLPLPDSSIDLVILVHGARNVDRARTR